MTDSESPRKTRKGGTRDGLFQRRGVWWLDFYDAEGRRHRQKGHEDYKLAKQLLRKRLAELVKAEVTGVRSETLTVSAFIDLHYWPTVKATLAPDWATRSREILDAIIQVFGETRLTGLRREAIEQWQATRRTVVKGSTANKELSRLRHCLARAVDWGYLVVSPAAAVEKAKEAAGRVRYLSPEERTALLDGDLVDIKSSDGRSWTMRREPNATLRRYMLAALGTGARRAELIRLRWQDVDLRKGTVAFIGTKSGENRTVPITGTFLKALDGLPRSLDPKAHVLPRIQPRVLSRSFARYVATLKIANLCFHDLRHDVASTLTAAGVQQRSIMAILGHKDPRMTIRYQHLAPGHLRDAIRALDQVATAPAEGR
jgi:integrase